jgi:hypothetical protein
MSLRSTFRRTILASTTVLVCALFLACSGQDGKATIEGDTAKIEMTIHHGAPFIDNLANTAFTVGQKVHAVAKANPSAKKAEVTLIMSKQGLQDKYGNAWTQDRVMGTITVPDLDEVRKYTDGGLYASSEAVKESYMAKISLLDYAYLLKEKW